MEVYEYFLPLRRWLIYFQSDAYKTLRYSDFLMKNEDVSPEFILNEFVETTLLYKNQFDRNELSSVAKVVVEDITRVLSSLKRPTHYPDTTDLENIEIKEIDQEKGEELFNKWKSELEYVREKISLLIYESPISEQNGTASVITVFQLPSDFKVSDFKDAFTSQLSPKEISLLFNVLTETKYTPMYTFKSYGQLGSALFGRNEKNIIDDIRKIDEIKKDENVITTLKGRIENINDFLESLLQELQKK